MRLHEIELGVGSTEASKVFYEMLGLKLCVDHAQLKVFDAAVTTVDLNVSQHFTPGKVCISFFTDDLSPIMKKLNEHHINFSGPKPTHLGMTAIELADPDGYTIRIHSK